MSLSEQDAKKFFSALYKQPPTVNEAFDRTVTGLVANIGSKTVVGDQALQSMMFNYVLNNPGQGSGELSAALAGIKQMAVNEFLKAYPNSSLDDIVASAKASGYKVEVLS